MLRPENLLFQITYLLLQAPYFNFHLIEQLSASLKSGLGDFEFSYRILELLSWGCCFFFLNELVYYIATREMLFVQACQAATR